MPSGIHGEATSARRLSDGDENLQKTAGMPDPRPGRHALGPDGGVLTPADAGDAYSWPLALTRVRPPWAAAGGRAEPAPGWLGFNLQNRADGQMVITTVHPESPCAGLTSVMPGDIVVSIGGTALKGISNEQLASVLRGAEGSVMELIVAVEFAPGESFPSQHVLMTGEVLRVDRVHRCESKEGAPARAPAPSVESTPTRLPAPVSTPKACRVVEISLPGPILSPTFPQWSN